MSDEEKEKNAEAEELEVQEQVQDAPAEEKVAEPSLEEELLKWRDTAMRTAAEYDNYRKRMVKEKEECAKFANQRLLEELLPVIDNFEMGMAAASADASSMIYIGMSMVKKQLDEFLAGNGVSAVEPVVGSMFDHRDPVLFRQRTGCSGRTEYRIHHYESVQYCIFAVRFLYQHCGRTVSGRRQAGRGEGCRQ